MKRKEFIVPLEQLAPRTCEVNARGLSSHPKNCPSKKGL
jgi:hypothetical protein